MKITYEFWLNLSIKVLGAILDVVSPSLRKVLGDYVQDLYNKAKETDNPWDDFLIKLLASLVGVELK
jgi:hypothetical protein